MYNEAWEKFFGNPVISSYLEEADMQPQPEMQQPEEETNADVQQLADDFQSGHVSQEDLVNMYRAGKINKNDLAEIRQMVENPPDGDEAAAAAGEEEEGPSEEELFAQQIDQTNDLFIKFSIYDKILELTDKLDYFKENFEDIESQTYERVIRLREFLNILSNLVFNIETSVAYQMYGSILLQLTEIFTEYNKNLSQRKQEEKIKDAQKKKFREGDVSTSKEDSWADDNKSHLMPDDSTN
jgi:hypothetical protein